MLILALLIAIIAAETLAQNAAEPDMSDAMEAPRWILTDTIQSMNVYQEVRTVKMQTCGQRRYLGWSIILAKFPNSGWFKKAGSNYFKESPTSGSPYLVIATRRRNVDPSTQVS